MKTWMSELFLSISLLEILIIGIILKNYEEPLGNKEPEESTDHQLWIHGYICWEGSHRTDLNIKLMILQQQPCNTFRFNFNIILLS